jgi:hypothetical protein
MIAREHLAEVVQKLVDLAALHQLRRELDGLSAGAAMAPWLSAASSKLLRSPP